ncbi:IclR family transcriptional regulator [Arthrobacter wenxiniae]|jgi:DNA-binding IclR family transcriptional regulator|uniref:IclR family transcriptional regulator n=1 Tax=Arthrobacter wenxiniae TaxID=2713570 RepID=A0A7Y7IK85_9MICC|nr:IclR family transcriptional regulator [Arthrobacter wenxiniae]NVM96992.1 IclR family transcriptional regulator [Arthrobacter wenxiniae]
MTEIQATKRASDARGHSSPAPAVTRAAAVLDALAASDSGRLTLSDLARELGIPKSSTSNLLQALEDTELITRLGADYALGVKLVELGAAYLSRRDEVREFYRFCEQAPTLKGETVRIAMLDGENIIYLARYEGHPAVRLTSNIGDKMPVSVCAVGKALVARLHDHDLEQLFPDKLKLPVMTPKSLKTGRALKDEIIQIRTQGYAFEDEESTLGVVCLGMAVPTRGAHGPSLGVSVTALKATFSDGQRDRMVGELRELVRTLGNPMG